MAQAVSALRRAREGSGASLDRRARQQLTARCFRTWLELERRGELRAEGGAQTAEQLTPLADEQLASHADSEGRLSAARPNYLPPAAPIGPATGASGPATGASGPESGSGGRVHEMLAEIEAAHTSGSGLARAQAGARFPRWRQLAGREGRAESPSNLWREEMEGCAQSLAALAERMLAELGTGAAASDASLADTRLSNPSGGNLHSTAPGSALQAEHRTRFEQPASNQLEASEGGAASGAARAVPPAGGGQGGGEAVAELTRLMHTDLLEFGAALRRETVRRSLGGPTKRRPSVSQRVRNVTLDVRQEVQLFAAAPALGTAQRAGSQGLGPGLETGRSAGLGTATPGAPAARRPPPGAQAAAVAIARREVRELVSRALRLLAHRRGTTRVGVLRAWRAVATARTRALVAAASALATGRVQRALRGWVAAARVGALRQALGRQQGTISQLAAELKAVKQFAALQRDALLSLAVDISDSSSSADGVRTALERRCIRGRPTGRATAMWLGRARGGAVAVGTRSAGSPALSSDDDIRDGGPSRQKLSRGAGDGRVAGELLRRALADGGMRSGSAADVGGAARRREAGREVGRPGGRFQRTLPIPLDMPLAAPLQSSLSA
ncbi:hypothetical protein T492DRAFT_1145041 [Pavlovales sp. CCMP2436]|nr:hypothetical protein T492DRAFT_1145041 [Pavlovales sp. CCMP2436]